MNIIFQFKDNSNAPVYVNSIDPYLEIEDFDTYISRTRVRIEKILKKKLTYSQLEKEVNPNITLKKVSNYCKMYEGMGYKLVYLYENTTKIKKPKVESNKLYSFKNTVTGDEFTGRIVELKKKYNLGQTYSILKTGKYKDWIIPGYKPKENNSYGGVYVKTKKYPTLAFEGPEGVIFKGTINEFADYCGFNRNRVRNIFSNNVYKGWKVIPTEELV